MRSQVTDNKDLEPIGLLSANFMQLRVMDGGAFRSPAFYPIGDSLATRSYSLGSYVRSCESI